MYVPYTQISLYTNIPNKEKNIGLRIILTFLHFVLTLNSFVFNCQNYLQIKGCAKGTKCAPSYANIFIWVCLKKDTYLPIETMSKFYLRFIDIFLIWTGTADQLMNFKQQINEIYPSLKIDFKFFY